MHPLAIDAKRETWRALAQRVNSGSGYYEALSIAAAQEIMALLDTIEQLQEQLGKSYLAKRKEETQQP